MPPPSPSTGLTVTNPLVLYRGLVANNKIKPDPAQHRLALQLQKLYFRLKDYDPELEYRQRLDQISRAIGPESQAKGLRVEDGPKSTRSDRQEGLLSALWRSNFGQSDDNETILSLTKTIPVHESAMTIQSPQGMLLYGEVGRGKSMLLDLLADSLPSRKKRRWHFNAFMLDTFRKLEKLRIEQMNLPSSLKGIDQEHSVLTLAREMISKSPILFLDEFQLPDRAASKLLSSFLTSFFHLGGVLIATSNRMPEELAKAAGVEFMPEPKSPLSKFGGLASFRSRPSEADRAASTDFGAFLEVLKARCEIWEMEGERDWRREHLPTSAVDVESVNDSVSLETAQSMVTSMPIFEDDSLERREQTVPPFYHLVPPADDPATLVNAESAWTSAVNDLFPLQSPLMWQTGALQVYGRRIPVSDQCNGITKWDFNRLCGTNLGPADYITLASTYHTLVLDKIPVLTSTLKNEARRFITLLDALYEARCRLLVRASAPPDYLFFPETAAAARTTTAVSTDTSDDNVYQETLAEIYQDTTNPFRPNISSYTPSPSSSSFTPRSILADEDADFGPTYGNGRGRGASAGEGVMAQRQQQQQSSPSSSGPDFTRTDILTGEDEQFAYKRARSRLWEMCGARWWEARDAARIPVEAWWRPMGRDMRHWEGGDGDSVTGEAERIAHDVAASEPVAGHVEIKTLHHAEEVGAREVQQDRLFRHGASPFRNSADPPPKFSWVHVWGMMRWGRRAGEWGKGVEGKRRKDVDMNDDKVNRG